MAVLQSENEELEQYGRRLCIRVERAPTTDNETSEEVLKKVQSLINEKECDIPDVAIDRAHCIGNGYKDRKTNTLCKTIIVRFMLFPKSNINFYFYIQALYHLCQVVTYLLQ